MTSCKEPQNFLQTILKIQGRVTKKGLGIFSAVQLKTEPSRKLSDPAAKSPTTEPFEQTDRCQ